MKTKFSLKNKGVVITGGGSGIGKAIAKTFAEQGADVHILDFNMETAMDTANEIKTQGLKASAHHCNVADYKQVSELVNQITKVVSVDILVNNAGIWLGKEINDVSMEEYQRLISINLTGVFLGIKYLTPFLIDAGKKSKYGSSIINLSSVAGLVGSQLDPLYSMTKGGITTFTKSMAIYFGKKKLPIRINQVHPGIIETEMGDQVSDARLKQNPNMTSEDSYLAGISQTPIGRLGTAEEVAKTILFLSSDESSFMTGSSLVVDGGLTAQ